MLSIVSILLIFCPYSFSTTSMGVIKDAQFTPSEVLFQLANSSMINDQLGCTCQCWTSSMCVTATYQETIQTCSLFSAQLWQGKLSSMNTTTITFPNKSVAVYNVNILMNGDGELGPCELGNSTTYPTGWSYYGGITQIAYNNIYYHYQSDSTPGPSDRGECYFVGNIGGNTSMYQTIDLNPYAHDIDNGNVSFNLSAWLGGYANQDDAASISIDFRNFIFQIIGNRTTLGPVLAIDRDEITEMLFRQTTGFVPINTRWMTISVNITWSAGADNDGCVDNIRFELKKN